MPDMHVFAGPQKHTTLHYSALAWAWSFLSLNPSPVEDDPHVLSPCLAGQQGLKWDMLGDRKQLMTSSSTAARQDVCSWGTTQCKPADQRYGGKNHSTLIHPQLWHTDGTWSESTAGSGGRQTPGCRLDNKRTPPIHQAPFPDLHCCLNSLSWHPRALFVLSWDKKSSLTY